VIGFWGAITSTLRISVNGYLLKTAALPLLSNLRASPGRIGLSGLFWVSSTKTKLDIEVLPCGVMFASSMFKVGNYIKSTGLTLTPV
jgi:hypothetical protein